MPSPDDIVRVAKVAFGVAALALTISNPCGAQQAIQGYSPVFRYDDDFSFLADPARRTDPVDVFKYLPLPVAPGAFVTFGVDDRERVEANADALLGFGYKPVQVYDLHRLLLDADLHVDDARVFVQIGSELEGGRRPGPIPLDADRLDLQQGFADYKLAAGSGQLVLRRRDDVSIEDERCVSTAYAFATRGVEVGQFNLVGRHFAPAIKNLKSIERHHFPWASRGSSCVCQSLASGTCTRDTPRMSRANITYVAVFQKSPLQDV